MKYIITRQYARDVEKPIAELNELNDAKAFVDKKLFFDEIQRVKLIYRIFEGGKLYDEFNKQNITVPILCPQYASCDRDLPESFNFQFNVFMRSDLLSSFGAINDAKIFIEIKLSIDSITKDNYTYSLFDFDTLVEEWNQDKRGSIIKQNQGTQGKVRTVSFRPTPFSTTPRPPGSPPPWIIDEENDDDDNNDK